MNIEKRTRIARQSDLEANLEWGIGIYRSDVLLSLRHTLMSRLGEAGADVFSIMKIAGHSSVTVSQRYVHPTPEGLERAFEKLQSLNSQLFEIAEPAKKRGRRKAAQVV